MPCKRITLMHMIHVNRSITKDLMLLHYCNQQKQKRATVDVLRNSFRELLRGQSGSILVISLVYNYKARLSSCTM